MFKKIIICLIFLISLLSLNNSIFAFNHKLRINWFSEEASGIKKEDVTSITIEDGGYDLNKIGTYWALDGYGLIAYVDGESDIVISIPENDTLETDVNASNLFSFFVFNEDPDYETSDNGVKIYGLNPPDEGYPVNTYSRYISKLESINNLYLLNTYCTENFDNMFMGLNELTEIDLSSMNTGFAKSMNNMFMGCEKLNKIDISSFDTTNVESMSGMFRDCKKLEQINIDTLKTHRVLNMSNMFQNCDNLKSINLNNISTGAVRDMSNMFYSCDNLQIINLDKIDTKEVRNMESMFYDCINLKFIDLSHFNTTGVNQCSLMFHNCRSLEALDLSTFNFIGNVKLNSMLSKLNNLNAIKISKYICDNIKDIDLQGEWINVETNTKYNFNNDKNKKPIAGLYTRKQ